MTVPVVAIFGPTGVGKTAVAVALADLLRSEGEEVVLVSADALQLYRGLEILTGASDAPPDTRLVGILDLHERCSAGRYADLAHAEIDAALTRGARVIVVGGTGLYLRAALADLDLRPPVPDGVRARWRDALAANGAPALHAHLAERDPAAAAAIAPTDAQRLVRAHELLDIGAPVPAGDQLWTSDTRHPTFLAGLTRDRDELARRIDMRVDAMVAAGAEEEVRRADAAGASDGARQALGFAELLAGDVDAMKTRTRRYAKRQLTWMRKLPGAHLYDLTGRSPEDVARDRFSGMIPAVRFEKWQALGNDYVIVEAAQLPEPLTPERVRALCDRHTGIGADGILELQEPSQAGYVARVRILNPDGSEAELSGNGVRQAILYLRQRGWTDSDVFSVETIAGEIRPTITGTETCRVDMGRASLTSKDFPDGPRDGRGELDGHRFQHVSIGNPQCAIRVESEADLAALDLQALGPPIERAPLFPNRTNVSFWTELGGDRIRARIFERGVGETQSSGTGACGAAVAHVLRGGDSPVTVVLDGGELEVDVTEDLHVDLSGWARCVYRGELAS